MQLEPTKTEHVAPRTKRPAGVAYLVGRVDHVFKRLMREKLKSLDLTVSQYTALSFLADHRSVSNARLAELAMISPQSINEMVKAMELKGWITRKPDESDSRVLQIALSPKGHALLLEGDKRVQQIEIGMLKGIDESDQNFLHQFLRQLLENVKTSSTA